jgi:hypothetical protein
MEMSPGGLGYITMRLQLSAKIRRTSFNFFKGFAIGAAVGTWHNMFFGFSESRVLFTLITSIGTGIALVFLERQKD